MSINVLWARGNRGSWDSGLLDHALTGRLWPLPVDFRHTMGLVAENGEGAIVVIAGRHMADEDGKRYLKAALDRLPWALIVHVGDEELNFPSEQFRYPARRILLQCPSPFLPIRGDRNIPLGWPEDARAWLLQDGRKAASGRTPWGFLGQKNHAGRERMFEELLKREDGGLCNDTGGFGKGMGRKKYYEWLADQAVVPCPSGNFSPETFRLYEALEAGCIPIANRRAPNGGWAPGFDFYRWLFGDVPFPTVDDWSEVHAILDRFRDGPALTQATMTRCLAWWSGIKRAYALDLVRDCRELGADVPVSPVTVLIPCSPVPSHPSTEMIENTIARIRAYPELAKAEVIIMCDGVRPELARRANDYQEYLRVLTDKCNWSPELFGCLPLISDTWVHQAELTRRALALVRTPLVFFVEHDTHPVGSIPFGELFRCFEEPDINHVRLHIFESVIPEHSHLYGPNLSTADEYPLLQATRQYSQRPHLARTSWYRDLMYRYFPAGHVGFVEDRLCSPSEGGEVRGLYVYRPSSGSMLRSVTVDGRGSDPKAPA